MRARIRPGTDRGSVSLWLIIFALAVLVLLGFVVDGGQYMNARERAADIAQQAARAAVDDLNTGQLRHGDFVVPAAACQQQGVAGATSNGPAATLVSEYAGDTATIPQGGCVIGELTPGGGCEAETGTPPTGGFQGPCVKVTVEITVNPAIPVGAAGAFTAAATEQATLDCGNANQGGAC
jgi:Flp pilus assembly protein TadG